MLRADGVDEGVGLQLAAERLAEREPVGVEGALLEEGSRAARFLGGEVDLERGMSLFGSTMAKQTNGRTAKSSALPNSIFAQACV